MGWLYSLSFIHKNILCAKFKHLYSITLMDINLIYMIYHLSKPLALYLAFAWLLVISDMYCIVYGLLIQECIHFLFLYIENIKIQDLFKIHISFVNTLVMIKYQVWFLNFLIWRPVIFKGSFVSCLLKHDLKGHRKSCKVIFVPNLIFLNFAFFFVSM